MVFIGDETGGCSEGGNAASVTQLADRDEGSIHVGKEADGFGRGWEDGEIEFANMGVGDMVAVGQLDLDGIGIKANMGDIGGSDVAIVARASCI